MELHHLRRPCEFYRVFFDYSQQSCPVIPLEQNARYICQKQINDHYYSAPPDIPQEKYRHRDHMETMGKLAPAGFPGKGIKIILGAALQVFFGKTTPEHLCTIRDYVFPSLYLKNARVYLSTLLTFFDPEEPAVRIEALYGYFCTCP